MVIMLIIIVTTVQSEKFPARINSFFLCVLIHMRVFLYGGGIPNNEVCLTLIFRKFEHMSTMIISEKEYYLGFCVLIPICCC